MIGYLLAFACGVSSGMGWAVWLLHRRTPKKDTRTLAEYRADVAP